jgi:phosphatidylserine/phosphatidylglycerophosphate/cardiolipin synthase-like enzyme
LHTRTIVRDGRQAFIGSQSLRAADLDSRREVGLIVRDAKIVKKLMETFESDWASSGIEKTGDGSAEKSPVPKQETDQAMRVLIEELHPIATTVKKAVQKVVSQAGEEVLEDGTVQETLTKVVKKVVKQAVKEAAKTSLGT